MKDNVQSTKYKKNCIFYNYGCQTMFLELGILGINFA